MTLDASESKREEDREREKVLLTKRVVSRVSESGGKLMTASVDVECFDVQL